MKFSRRKPPSLTWILLPLVALLFLSAATDMSFGRQAPPTQVPPLEGGGDEWPNTAIGPSGPGTFGIQESTGTDQSTRIDCVEYGGSESNAKSASKQRSRLNVGPSILIWILIRIL
jgi:hypothetical protein